MKKVVVLIVLALMAVNMSAKETPPEKRKAVGIYSSIEKYRYFYPARYRYSYKDKLSYRFGIDYKFLINSKFTVASSLLFDIQRSLHENSFNGDLIRLVSESSTFSYQVPVRLEYRFTDKKISPFVGLGFTVDCYSHSVNKITYEFASGTVYTEKFIYYPSGINLKAHYFVAGGLDMRFDKMIVQMYPVYEGTGFKTIDSHNANTRHSYAHRYGFVISALYRF